LGKPALPAKSCAKSLAIVSFREAKVSEAFAIRFADKMVCALNHALTFFEPFNFIDELFSSIRVIAENDHVGLGGGPSQRKCEGMIIPVSILLMKSRKGQAGGIISRTERKNFERIYPQR